MRKKSEIAEAIADAVEEAKKTSTTSKSSEKKEKTNQRQVHPSQVTRTLMKLLLMLTRKRRRQVQASHFPETNPKLLKTSLMQLKISRRDHQGKKTSTTSKSYQVRNN